MPIDLAGISNENEFFSEHYLTTIFEGDVEETLRAWREQEKTSGSSPHKLLEKAGATWRRLAATYVNERDDRKRLLIGREFAHDFLAAIGFERRSELVADAEGKLLPVLARRFNLDGRDAVWIVEVPSPAGADFEIDPLQVRFRCEQFEGFETAEDIANRRKDVAEAAIVKGIFALEAPPRFVILLSMSQAVLIDRQKWSDSRLLRFSFPDIFGRAEPSTIAVTAAFLHATSLVHGAGTSLIDRIDEESHRHAYGVSQDLKFALRQAIELLGNEAASLIVQRRKAQQKGVYSGDNALDAGVLTTECLRYMYRLLFLFFIEARPELGFAPMKSKAYRAGYSLESLRELELVQLQTEEDRNGHFISDTLDTLFGIVFEGTPGADLRQGASGEEFTFHPVRARLFSPEAVGTYLRGLRFRNATMQQIIALLSLSRGGNGQRRGRISYAQLGISQLGAVYESLLSFSGFFASEDLLELKPADKPAPGPLEAAFFIPRSRAGEFKAEEFVFEGSAAKLYPRGAFIYRLAGRHRENSASYYTPEPLARVLVKYALKDLLDGKKADDILKLRIVEPAMGSAAFLVEVVNQLADKYLDLKQTELKRRIPHDRYALERQKVRAYLADRNVFGVDLNPIAVELGQVSLWLDCLHEGGFAPWFEDQVHAGNSLVGARRAVFPTASLNARRDEDRWHKRRPREIGWSGEARQPDEVWHFLLPDPGMSSYDPKIVRPLAAEAWATFGEWRRDFMKPLDKDEIETARRLSAVVDQLFEDVADRLRDFRQEVNDDIAIWPAEAGPNERHVDFQEKIRRLASFQGQDVKNAVSWRRLRSAMDAWCALWFWPIDKADELPSRTKFFQDLDLILTQGVEDQKVVTGVFATGSPQGRLFETITVPGEKGSGTLFRAEERIVELQRNSLFGDVDVDQLIAASPWLPTAMKVARRHRFMHFDLEFADVMRERGGFDLVIGNPPWLKPAWSDPHILSEFHPEIAIRGLSAASVDAQKDRFIDNGDIKSIYLDQYISMGGLQSFISAKHNYPYIGGGGPNLYQCFIDLSFRIISKSGISALIHQDSHLMEPKLHEFRFSCFSRLIRHFNFRNEIYNKMFSEVNHSEIYSANIYSGRERPVSFDHISGLFLPETIVSSYEHDGIGPVPGIRTDSSWDTRGHRKRIVKIDSDVIAMMSKMTLDEDMTDAGRFIYPHSTETLSVMKSLSSALQVGRATAGAFQVSPMWHEGAATKQRKLIKIGGAQKSSLSELIIKSPCIFVGNPLYKTPNEGCVTKEDYELIDLSEVPDDYFPRSNFSSTVDIRHLYENSTDVPWSNALKHCDHYRIAFRGMVQPSRERTLAAALIPPSIQHVDSLESMSFEREADLINVYPYVLSLPLDFLVKSMQVEKVRDSIVRHLPISELGDTAKSRALRLACLTSHYRDIWDRNVGELKPLEWSSSDHRLILDGSNTNLGNWSRDVAIRTDFARRMALVEIDVLVAQSFGLTLDQLIEIYKTQFYVLYANESGTWYDQNGRIVWTSAKGLGGAGWRKPDGKKPSAREWLASYADLEAGRTLECDVAIEFLPDGPKKVRRVFEAPFTTCDREADYRTAWAFFEAHAQKKAA
jgi:hypothetical protein